MTNGAIHRGPTRPVRSPGQRRRPRPRRHRWRARPATIRGGADTARLAGSAPIATALKAANLALRFLLELTALAALVYWGLRTGATLLADVLLAVAAPLAFATLWGLFAAPRAPHRLRDPWRLLFEAILFALTAGALVGADQPRLGGLFLVVALANALAVRVLGEPGAKA